MVVGDHVRAVVTPPAAGREVIGEQGLLATEEQHRMEAAHVQVGAAADHGRAGEEAEDLDAGQAGRRAQR